MDQLSGIRVVELASVLAGPSVGMFLAELGAEVIKIEPPGKGDVTRSWKLPSEDANSTHSAYFSSCNAGKQHRFVDWRSDSGKHEVQDLMHQADILLTNFRDFSRVDPWLQPHSLGADNPRLIYCQLDGYETDPGRPAYDVVLQAETGYFSMNGSPECGPVKLPLAFMDLKAAHQMKEAILLALYQRERHGKGCLIRASLERSALAGLANQSTNWLMAGHVASPMGSLHPNIAPYGETFTCSDGGLIVLAVGSDVQFKALCLLLGKGQWTSDERFENNSQRVSHRSQLAESMQPLFSSKTADEWAAALRENGIPGGKVRTLDEVHESTLAGEMMWEEEMDGQATRRLSSLGFRTFPLTTSPS